MSAIINIYCLKSSKRFEAKVRAFYPYAKNIEIQKLDLYSHGGYGQYKDYLTMLIDDEIVKLCLYHTNSVEVDNFRDLENSVTINNFYKVKVLQILEANN